MAGTTSISLRKRWREFQRGKPGRRFQVRYERTRKSERRGGLLRRIMLVALALVLFAVGIVFVAIPGPAIPFFLLSGGLLATESRGVARFMDWGEVVGRRISARAARYWKRLPRVAQILIIVLGACGSAATAYLGYTFLRR